MPHKLLTIGEFAARAGVAATALRFYERRGLIHSVRTSGNQRRYQRSELRRVAFIRTAQSVGLTLTEITEALGTLPESRTPTRADWAKLSEGWHRRLTDQIRMLERLRDDLSGCIGCGCLSLTSCSLYNRDDELAAHGAGPRILLED
ncbi:MerR family redox-sensitive transcriptional activator SoxR [Stackebrandtia albiflava]|uniref:MerR family redox-sensitive transcriptional activator SoxR n=1 Tax=Stackebrandtia albiflava TaxID=406432 RepID=A0A562V155_9ACTN|nr:redox-sensitive transcriptional activator SoxR [Stackebrandtia albiflava]TWJ11656.1 MerR family redox-sensitive transcriptional activator SoxR [Stackebrandtia albiflava]